MKNLEVPCDSIVRIWSGKVPVEKAEEYSRFLAEKAIPDYSKTPGNRGVIILRELDDEKFVKFTLITFWESLESIKKFAGNEYWKAKYYDEDKDFLIDFPERVEHYKIDHCHSTV